MIKPEKPSPNNSLGKSVSCFIDVDYRSGKVIILETIKPYTPAIKRITLNDEPLCSKIYLMNICLITDSTHLWKRVISILHTVFGKYSCESSRLFQWRGPLTKYVKLRVAHAPGVPGRFSPATEVKGKSELAIPACITARAWRMYRDAYRDCLPAVAGKTFPAFPAHAHPQFYVFGRRPIVTTILTKHWNHHGANKGGDVYNNPEMPFITEPAWRLGEPGNYFASLHPQ